MDSNNLSLNSKVKILRKLKQENLEKEAILNKLKAIDSDKSDLNSLIVSWSNVCKKSVEDLFVKLKDSNGVGEDKNSDENLNDFSKEFFIEKLGFGGRIYVDNTEKFAVRNFGKYISRFFYYHAVLTFNPILLSEEKK